MKTNVLISGILGAVFAVFVTGAFVAPARADVIYPAGTVSVAEYGRNVTLGQSGQYTALSARGNDTLDILVHIKNVSTWNATNVYITGLLPTGLIYVPRSTTINGISTTDGVTSIGLGFAVLTPGQEVVVKFSAVVDPLSVPALGRSDRVITAQVRTDGNATVSASLPVVVSQTRLAAVAGVKTGPADSILVSLAIALLTTGIYAGYTRTNTFGRRMTLAEVSALSGKALNFSR